MTTVRYKFIENQTTQVLTIGNFVSNCMITNDGDIRQLKAVKRVITVADIGTDPGEIGHPEGAIVDIIPAGSNVLWILGFIHRPGIVQNGMTPYQNLDNQVSPIPTPTTQCEVLFGVALDNTIRIIDKGNSSLPVQIGDIATVIMFMGYPQFHTDVMNP